MNIDKGILGNAIKNARIEKGFTQEKLAAMLDIDPTHMRNLESERRKPSIELLYKLVKILNFSVDDLFFPENVDGQELRHNIERRLRDCSAYELRVIYATIEAMLDKSDK